jgi:hypothetical protein
MSLFYKVSYRLGFHPWEDLARALAVADQPLSRTCPGGTAILICTGERE